MYLIRRMENDWWICLHETGPVNQDQIQSEKKKTIDYFIN